MDINAEVYAFLTMVYCGIVMGILFSVYCEKRRLFKRGPIMGPIEDILFWIVQAGVLFYFCTGATTVKSGCFQCLELQLALLYIIIH